MLSVNKDAMHSAAPEISQCTTVTIDDAEYSATPAIQHDVEHVKQEVETEKHNVIVVSVGDTDCHNREAAGETQVCVC